MARFFQVLWRINAVLVFFALVALIAFVVLFSKERITKPLIHYFVPPPQAAAVKPKPVYSYVLEKDLLIGADPESENFEIYRLERWGKIKGRAAPDASAIVNLLVTDKEAKTQKWLFQGFERIIIGQEPMLTGRWYWREPEADDDIPVEIALLKVVEADSNGDGALSGEDRQTLYVARFAAVLPAPEKLLTADDIWFTVQKNKTLQVGYRDGGAGFIAVYALPDFALVSKTRIEGMPKPG